jgi:ribosomal protein S18 acetylase RimI-like enzyme
MFISIKHIVKEDPIVELLSYSQIPDPDKLEEAVRSYQESEALELYGWEENGVIVGIIGFASKPDDRLVIKHIAVDPGYRGQGYGRGLLLELLELKKPALMIAETDEEAVDFYRNVGFVISSLGQTYPGVERFRCEYDASLLSSDTLD